jgi:hypothetical protein
MRKEIKKENFYFSLEDVLFIASFNPKFLTFFLKMSAFFLINLIEKGELRIVKENGEFKFIIIEKEVEK